MGVAKRYILLHEGYNVEEEQGACTWCSVCVYVLCMCVCVCVDGAARVHAHTCRMRRVCAHGVI